MAAAPATDSAQEIMNLLLSQPQIDLEVSNSQGRSLLHIAAHYGRVELVERLIGLGADASRLDNVRVS